MNNTRTKYVYNITCSISTHIRSRLEYTSTHGHDHLCLGLINGYYVFWYVGDGTFAHVKRRGVWVDESH